MVQRPGGTPMRRREAGSPHPNDRIKLRLGTGVFAFAPWRGGEERYRLLHAQSHYWRYAVLDLTDCPDSMVSALIELLTASVKNRYLNEAERLLAALHLMRPKFRELHIYDVWLMMGRKRFPEATQMLRALEGESLQAPYGAYVGALMAVCLFSQRDPSWQVFANEVLTREEDSESVYLVNMLMGKKDAVRPAQTEVEVVSADSGAEGGAGSASVKVSVNVSSAPAGHAVKEISPFSTSHFMRA